MIDSAVYERVSGDERRTNMERSESSGREPEVPERLPAESPAGSSPIRDIDTLLSGMKPKMRDGRYVFISVAPSDTGSIPWEAAIREDEGMTLVVRQTDADLRELEYDYVAAWITLEVHSALDAVGLTAAVSTRLAAVGLSCNVIAGNYHDHLLVDYDDRHRAMQALENLAS